MKHPRHLLVQAIGAKTLGVQDSKKLAVEIAAYLLSENRVNELDSILRDVIEYRAEHGVVEVQAVSSHELSNKVKDDIKVLMKQNYPNAKSVTVSQRIDPDVVGGIRVVLPHEQLDLTVQSKLSNFKRLTMAGKE